MSEIDITDTGRPIIRRQALIEELKGELVRLRMGEFWSSCKCQFCGEYGAYASGACESCHTRALQYAEEFSQ